MIGGVKKKNQSPRESCSVHIVPEQKTMGSDVKKFGVWRQSAAQLIADVLGCSGSEYMNVNELLTPDKLASYVR